MNQNKNAQPSTPPTKAELLAAFDRPQRTETLRTDIVTSRGGARLEKPDLDVLSEIHTNEPRVTYFGVADTEAFLGSPDARVGEPEFYKLVMKPLAERINSDFPDRRLRLRGIKTSINGAVHSDGMTVLDIEDVVNAGDEQLASHFLTAGHSKDDPHFPIHHRVAQYASNTDLFRLEVEEEASKGIFPAVLVYDADQLNIGSNYATELKDPSRADEAILGAYVLDCPLSSLSR